MKINKKILKERLEKIDKTIMIIVYLLVTISTIFIYSATRSLSYVKNNIMWILIGSVILVISLFFDYKITKKYINYLNLLSILTLLYVRFFGKKTLGAQRWISLGSIQIQPSEIIKIVAIMIISYTLVTKFKNGIKNLWDIIFCFSYVLPILLLILIQPDLGNTLIIVFSYLCIIYLADANIKPLIYIMLIAMISAYPVYKFVLSDYQKVRIETFINPEKDIRGKGWHVTQSKISIGSGGYTGSGILNGSQSRLKFLPEPQTDFIFSVISEETGFIGASFILFLYFLLIYNMLNITRIIDDKYGKCIIYGVVGIFLGHTIINIGMTLGLVPVTGKTLLFMSYGGSSYLSAFCMIALVQNIRMNVK